MTRTQPKHKFIAGFICPQINCNSQAIYFSRKQKSKKFYRCAICEQEVAESIDLTPNNLSKYGGIRPILQGFYFDSDNWDLRTINPSFNERDLHRIRADFKDIKLNYFKILVKNYVYHLCKINKSILCIQKLLSCLRSFSYYLAAENINSINDITRDTILEFINLTTTGKYAIINRLWALKDFFEFGNIQGLFQIEQDIIKSEDYPKIIRGNPDPISEIVREQIEKNLHKLPEPIARMWILAFFTAMRPNELALLKKDCLVQENADWKIIWQRRKSNDYHEIPVTRTIAKVVQEQQEYIDKLWGSDWDYLFCHYKGFSHCDPYCVKIEPTKKVIPQSYGPLHMAISSLIKAEDIKDENGKLALFKPRLVRPTRLTHLFEQGHDLAVVSAWAGHKNLATTSIFYTYVSCDLIEKEAGHIQAALFNADGQPIYYQSMPKSFWENPRAHQIELSGNHINTPIYGYCGLPLEQHCDKFRACYTCIHFVAKVEKLALYIKTRDELRVKESSSKTLGHDVLAEQFGRQAGQLDKIIAGLQGGQA
jgi:integrase